MNKHAHVTGGADQHVLLLRRALEAHGFSVALLATEGGDADFELGCSVTHASRDALSPPAQAAVAQKALWNVDAARMMRKAITEFGPDLIHTHKLYPQLSVAPVVIAKRGGVPIVQTVHDYEFISANPLDHTGGVRDRLESRRSYRLLNDLMFLARRRLHVPAVTSWVAVSDAVAQKYRARGVSATVVPNFVVNGGGSANLTRSGIVFVGRLTEEKGVRELIALARRVPDIPVSVAGWGPLAPVVEAASKELGNVRFAGRVEPSTLQAMYAGARATIVPSLWEEPGALSVLESMAAGTPLVAYSRGGAAEYVRNAEAGIVVEPNVAALEAGVRTLLGDAALWTMYSSNAVKSVATTHSAASYVQQLSALYDHARRS